MFCKARRRRRSQTFFVWLTYDRPHSPTTLPEPWFSRIRPDRVPLQPMPGAEQWTRLPPSWFHDLKKNASLPLLGEADLRFIGPPCSLRLSTAYMGI
jgi:hypothetical protein